METTLDGGEDRTEDDGPVMHDHGVVESEGHEPQRHRNGVAYSIPMPRFTIVGLAVCLEDEAISEHEVDIAHTGDRNLTREAEAPPMKPQSKKGLQPAVGIGACEVDEPAVLARDRGPKPITTGVVQKALTQRGLERREERLLPLTREHLRECLHETHRETPLCGAGIVAVDDAARGFAGLEADRDSGDVAVGVDPHVRAGVFGAEDPEPECLTRGHARDEPAVTQRFVKRGVRR